MAIHSLCHLGEWGVEAGRRGKEEKVDFSTQPRQGLHQRGPDTWHVALVHSRSWWFSEFTGSNVVVPVECLLWCELRKGFDQNAK